MQTPWILKSENANEWEIQKCPARFWPVTVIEEYPVEFSGWEGKDINFSGKGTMWMYAYLGALAAHAGAASASSMDAATSGKIRFFPLPGNSSCRNSELNWNSLVELDDKAFMLKMLRNTADSRWPFSILDSWELPPLHGKSLIVTGKAAAWMYGAVAAEAVRKGAISVQYSSPKDLPLHSLVIYHDDSSRIGSLFELPESAYEKHDGHILGILGDPNSGKSVFSHILESSLAKLNIDGWLFDCDAASPTPNWYLSSLKTHGEQVKNLRNSQKLKWSVEIENSVAGYMANLKKALPLTIADLPGGDHSNDKSPYRIPFHREIIMKEVDSFLIISRDNENIAALWREELKKHSLSDRIKCILISKNPQKPINLKINGNKNGVIWGEIEGLDRTNLSNLGNIFNSNHILIDTIKELLGEI